MKTLINSEFGKLEGVIIHSPGPEVENMTPENAERALYSDILNLSIAAHEYAQLEGILNKVTTVFRVKELLTNVLSNSVAKMELLNEICSHEGIIHEAEPLADNQAGHLTDLLIEGVPLERNNLTNYLNHEKFLLRPLHNLFFIRDSAMAINDKILIGRMANPVREREAMIMEAIFKYHPSLETTAINSIKTDAKSNPAGIAKFEGGDLQIIRDDIFLIGIGMRTSTQGIDFLIESLKQQKNRVFNLIIQELPSSPESFIHLDMVFTCLNTFECMVYDPLIYRLNLYRTIHILIENGRVIIQERPNIPSALKKLGIDLKPISCGGKDDLWIQEREQWHSGANFFAFSPGKIIGYERNVHTLEELDKNGYEIIPASDVINEKVSVDDYNKCAITIAGSELPRGGGGARCMTLPVRRTPLDW
jgi:arginine deiminase